MGRTCKAEHIGKQVGHEEEPKGSPPGGGHDATAGCREARSYCQKLPTD